MEIYSFYKDLIRMNLTMNGITGISKQSIFGSLIVAVLMWIPLFVLRGIGLCTMAKRKRAKKAWLAFVPFANLLLVDKLAGDVEFFGHKMKRAGLYAMLAGISVFISACAIGICQGVLFTRYAQSIDYNSNTMSIIWTNLDSTGKVIYNFYNILGSSLYAIFGLVYQVLLFLLMISLYKRYATKNYVALMFLQLFLPQSHYIVLFVIRNNKAIDYKEYTRMKTEEYFRRTGQGNPYGNANNPYGNPFGNSYGNPYGNPFGGAQGRSQNAGQQNSSPFGDFSDAEKDIDPFDDINDYSSRNKGNGSSQSESESTADNESSNDGFF